MSGSGAGDRISAWAQAWPALSRALFSRLLQHVFDDRGGQSFLRGEQLRQQYEADVRLSGGTMMATDRLRSRVDGM